VPPGPGPGESHPLKQVGVLGLPALLNQRQEVKRRLLVLDFFARQAALEEDLPEIRLLRNPPPAFWIASTTVERPLMLMVGPLSVWVVSLVLSEYRPGRSTSATSATRIGLGLTTRS